MADAFPVSTPMLEDDRQRWTETATPLLDPSGKKRYQAAVGSILYIMHATRPDIAYTIIWLSQYAFCLRTIHWEGIKRLLRYLKGTRDYALTLGNVKANTGSGSTELLGYFDAAHMDNGNKRSTCSYLFLLQSSPIS